MVLNDVELCWAILGVCIGLVQTCLKRTSKYVSSNNAGGFYTNTLASFEQGLTIYVFIADSHLKCFSKDLLLVAGTYLAKQSSPAR